MNLKASRCGDIVRMVASGNLTLCIDARILSEYREVLARPKFSFDPDKVAAVLDYIEHHGWVVEPNIGNFRGRRYAGFSL